MDTICQNIVVCLTFSKPERDQGVNMECQHGERGAKEEGRRWQCMVCDKCELSEKREMSSCSQFSTLCLEINYMRHT